MGVGRVFEAHAQECLVIKYEDVVVEVGCVFFAESSILAVAEAFEGRTASLNAGRCLCVDQGVARAAVLDITATPSMQSEKRREI